MTQLVTVRQPRARKESPTRPRSAKPFTLAHFREWASHLILDTGKPWRLEPFQEAFLRDVFAGIPECWLVVPEGNGKTTLVAGLALYHCEFAAFAMVPVAAASREQAVILYRQAEGFVRRTPRLGLEFRCLPGHRRVAAGRRIPARDASRLPTFEGNGSLIQILAADDRTGDGVIPTMCIVDELHRHQDLSLYRTWRGKLEKRGGQIVTISTGGEHGGEFELTRERIRQAATTVTRRGCFVRAASSELVLHEWAVPEEGDVEDLELVKRANPFSGVTVEMLRRKRLSPTMTIQHWRRFVCNLPTRSELAAITEVEWHKAATAERIPAGEPVWLGLDLAWKYDTTAAVPLWVRDREFRLFGAARVLTPPRDGSLLNPDSVEGMLLDLHHVNPIHTVVMDMSKAEQLAVWITREIGAEVIDRGQSNTAAVLDYDRFMEALREGWLHHAGDADLTKHALNAIARALPGGDTRFERPSQTRQGGDQERRVIDALTAAAMVHTTAVAEFYAPEEQAVFAAAWR